MSVKAYQMHAFIMELFIIDCFSTLIHLFLDSIIKIVAYNMKVPSFAGKIPPKNAQVINKLTA